jgi:cell division protein FtsZ
MMGTAVARGDNRAQEAADQAIRSPLLEDIDLKGASGILVNIAAGEDLSLGEFTEVGNIVEEYASDDATIVVGTVIDPELGDDIKVTVVATGLDRGEDANLRVVHSKQGNGRKPDGSLDLDQIELPTILRRQREEALIEKPGERKSSESGRDESDYGMLDIPTFLRRQAD